MPIGEIDLGGNVVVAREFKSGAQIPGSAGNIRQTTAGGSTLTVNRGTHLGRTVLLDTASGSVITLPAASGTGDTYQFYVSTTVSSNNHIIKVANASDTMVGMLETATTTGATTNGFCEAAGGTDDTITMNGTTTGGIVGTYITATDISTNVWLVRGFIVGSGALASSLSATV